MLVICQLLALQVQQQEGGGVICSLCTTATTATTTSCCSCSCSLPPAAQYGVPLHVPGNGVLQQGHLAPPRGRKDEQGVVGLPLPHATEELTQGTQLLIQTHQGHGGG